MVFQIWLTRCILFFFFVVKLIQWWFRIEAKPPVGEGSIVRNELLDSCIYQHQSSLWKEIRVMYDQSMTYDCHELNCNRYALGCLPRKPRMIALFFVFVYISDITHTHPNVYVCFCVWDCDMCNVWIFTLVYLFLEVHERYEMRLRRKLRFEERMQSNQQRVSLVLFGFDHLLKLATVVFSLCGWREWKLEAMERKFIRLLWLTHHLD